MPRPKNPVPSYRLHRQSGQAVVTLPLGAGRRRDVLLGRYDTPDSRAEYLRVIAEWEASGRHLVAVESPRRVCGMTVNELILAFWRHAEDHYRHPDGRPTSELGVFRLALRPLKELYGHTPAAEFGPLALKAVRQRMVDRGGSRRVINRHVGRIKRVFKWAAGEELVSVAVFQALTAVGGLQAGRTAARERPPVGPVGDDAVNATLPFLSRHVRGVVEFVRLTGCRPGEACELRMCDVDRSGPVWVYRPPHHKTAHRGRVRAVFIGPKAQALVAGFAPADPTEFAFSPARSTRERATTQRAARRTRVQPSQADRRKVAPTRRPGAAYHPHAIAHAVRVAVGRANRRRLRLAGPVLFDPVPHWHPNQLRHSFATAVRRDSGVEAAQVLLGHARADVTQVYAERDEALAVRIAGTVG